MTKNKIPKTIEWSIEKYLCWHLTNTETRREELSERLVRYERIDEFVRFGCVAFNAYLNRGYQPNFTLDHQAIGAAPIVILKWSFHGNSNWFDYHDDTWKNIFLFPPALLIIHFATMNKIH